MANFGSVVQAMLANREKKKMEKTEQIGKLLPVLAQMGMLQPGGQGPGAMPYAGFNWTPTAKTPDVGDVHTGLQSQKLRYDLGLEPPNDAYLRNEAADLVMKMKFSDPFGYQTALTKSGLPENQFIESGINQIVQAKKSQTTPVTEIPKQIPKTEVKNMAKKYKYKGKTYYSNDNINWYDENGTFFGSK
jgi:hypothetical protein